MSTDLGRDRTRKKTWAGAIVALAMSVPAPASAEPQPFAMAAPATLSLTADKVARDGAFVATLTVELAPGWKTFWRSPGEAGIPPRFDWTGSENVASIEVVWPSPHAFEAFGSRMYGYDGVVAFPIVVTPTRPERPSTLYASIFLGVCEQVCVPVAERFQLAFDPSASASAATTSAGGETTSPRQGAPETGAAVEELLVNCGVDPRREGRARLSAEIAPGAEIRPRLALVEAGDGSGAVSEAAWRRGRHGGWLIEGDAPHATDAAAAGGEAPTPILTVIGEQRALEFRQCGR